MGKSINAVLLVSTMIGAISNNPLEWALTIFAAWLMLSNFLKPREHPVLILALLIPFLEISTSLINAEMNGYDLNQLFGNSGQEAYFLSIVTFVFFLVGLRFSMRRSRGFPVLKSVEDGLRVIPMRKLVYGHLTLLGLSLLTQELFSFGSSLFQLVLHVSKFPLIFLYLIIWKFALTRENRWLVYSVFLANLAMRLTGFFSDWKELVFLLSYVSFVVVQGFDSRWLRKVALTGLVGGLFLFTWQAIKVDYRLFLNGGTKSQRVVVEANEALAKFAELTVDYWFTDDNEHRPNDLVLQSTLDRIGYLDFFAKTVERVPDELPHERGQLILGNLTFALVPRILFPNKGIKNDQLKVEKFAGVDIADHASFSLGRYVEWYVDFGLGMVFLGLLFGFVGSVIVRVVRRNQSLLAHEFLDPIFCLLVLQNFFSYQSDEVVIYGQTFWAIVVYLGFGRRLMAQFLTMQGRS